MPRLREHACMHWLLYPSSLYFSPQVDPSGPLATLRKILLSEESIESLRNFLVTHWYSVILMAVAVLVLMVRIREGKSPNQGCQIYE